MANINCRMCSRKVTQTKYGQYCSEKCVEQYKLTKGHLRHIEMFACDVKTINKFLTRKVT